MGLHHKDVLREILGRETPALRLLMQALAQSLDA